MARFNKLSPVNSCRITMADGTVIETTTALQDTLAFEQAQRRPLVSSSAGVPLTSDLIWLAWHAACREQKTEIRQFEAFKARIEEFEVAVKDAESVYENPQDDLGGVLGADPTQTAV